MVQPEEWEWERPEHASEHPINVHGVTPTHVDRGSFDVFWRGRLKRRLD
jgi:hypothetical protein